MKLVVIHMGRYNLTLLKKEKVARNAWAFVLEEPGHFAFNAGQYVRIFDPIDGESVFRDFTIASSPQQKDYLLLIIKEGISEYKKHLFAVKEGEKLLVDAPLGRFSIQDEEKVPLVFIAGGVGITPFYSMIQDIHEKNIPQAMTLIASFSNVEDVLFFKELKELEKVLDSLRIIYTVTQPEKPLKELNFHRGRISEGLINNYVTDIHAPKFLISGSPSFVLDMESLLTQMGISSRQIRIEVFLGF